MKNIPTHMGGWVSNQLYITENKHISFWKHGNLFLDLPKASYQEMIRYYEKTEMFFKLEPFIYNILKEVSNITEDKMIEEPSVKFPKIGELYMTFFNRLRFSILQEDTIFLYLDKNFNLCYSYEELPKYKIGEFKSMDYSDDVDLLTYVMLDLLEIASDLDFYTKLYKFWVDNYGNKK